ncbi:MAG: hypothetical protein Alis3KO_15730 [Aliiglaciecola sp.]|uniref:TMEM175 family protein n=1 Tax=Aliiglaciecola sp. M165 TaxID=2593649 RepID=UPI00117E8F34|nr:TMEM175 family protein [Aliiglaciecola sp. M165]TRY31482.1 DUF1211 domain-containing protein [Aliiglaciecola sp. M165]
MRKTLGEKGFGDDPGFRWRGGDVSRIEGLSDAVFAFAMTLLIVSLEVPKSFDGLINTLLQFPAFGIAFIFLFSIWYHHYVFFRRYGLNNMSIVVVNGLLMFLVLFFVFPFRWAVSFVINFLFFNLFLGLDVPLGIEIDGFTMERYSIIHSFYAGGILAIHLCFAWFYYKAYRLHKELALDEQEIKLTYLGIIEFFIVVGICVLSILLVWIVPAPFNGQASGWIFVLIWPLTYFAGKKVRADKVTN